MMEPCFGRRSHCLHLHGYRHGWPFVCHLAGAFLDSTYFLLVIYPTAGEHAWAGLGTYV